jgi:hypothetical protein
MAAGSPLAVTTRLGPAVALGPHTGAASRGRGGTVPMGGNGR